jgi:hypothetical protein
MSSVLAACLLSWVVHADERSMTSEGAVAADEQRFTAAAAADGAALERLLADELVYCHSSGMCESKTSFIESVKSGALDYEFIRPEKPTVTFLNDVVILSGRASMRVSRDHAPMRTLTLGYTDVFVWRDGRWQLVAWRSTELPKAL